MKYPLGIQTFSKIRKGNCLYIDKTAFLYDLINQGEVYFLSRPRRFGKSLLISTFEALFSGQKNLFDGLQISKTDYDFAVYPVIKLEFAKDEFATADNLRDYIYGAVDDIASRYAIELAKQSHNQRFDELVVKLHEQTGQKVVLLIDEYDKPILNNLNKPVLVEIKAVMNAFYSAAKSLDEHLKFVFITGVSKFAKDSVFMAMDGRYPANAGSGLQGSGMNNLTDISMERRYATLCGVTQEELELNFSDELTQLAELEQLDRQQLLAKIKHWYNGYYFEESGPSVYNPYSLLSLFSKQRFSNYWYTTATPTFLLKLLQDQQYDLANLSQFAIGEAAFSASEPEHINVLSVFFQTGYLTIKAFTDPLYVLDFPNYEVKKSFYDSVIGYYGHINPGVGQSYSWQLIQQLNAGHIDDFFATLRCFFANIPYDLNIKQEKYYHALFYAIFTLLGMSIEAEVHTNQGRIDCVVQTADTIYIIEFKLNDTKEAALQQIHDKKYAQKYQNSGKEIVLLGVEFDPKERNIGEFVQARG